MFFCDIGELPFRTLQRRENLSKGCGAFGHGEILTLRLTQHLRIHCGRLTRHSEPTLALLQLLTGGMEAPVMNKKSRSKTKRTTTRSVLRLPDLEHAKTAVLNSLTSPDAQRGYRHAIDEFVDWYCSEPRLALNRTVVLRYRSHLESRQLAPGNLRLGAVRRLAYEAADCGLLSADWQLVSAG